MLLVMPTHTKVSLQWPGLVTQLTTRGSQSLT